MDEDKFYTLVIPKRMEAEEEDEEDDTLDSHESNPWIDIGGEG